MIHWGVFGESGSGKSVTMSQFIVPTWLWPDRYNLKRPPRKVLICDPQLKAMWRGKYTFITKDADEWMAALKLNRDCVGVWDEAGNSLQSDRKLERRMGWVPMESRNNGHLIYFICQRAGQLPIGYRNQCAQAFVFWQRSSYDRRELAESYGERMMEANKLTVGECFIAQPMKEPVKTRFFSIK